jgi:hypothetical protein
MPDSSGKAVYAAGPGVQAGRQAAAVGNLILKTALTVERGTPSALAFMGRKFRTPVKIVEVLCHRHVYFVDLQPLSLKIVFQLAEMAVYEVFDGM